MFHFARSLTIATFILAITPSAVRAQDFDSQNDSIELLIDAAHNLTVSLNADQQKKALYPLGDKEWLNIRLNPFGAQGLRFKELTPGQISLVHTIFNAGFSRSGYHKIASIIALEEYNNELEGRAGRDDNAHGIGNYKLSIFGTPGKDSTWSFRLHGHHLYLSLGVADGKLVSTSPSFFGGQPNEVTEGPRKGWFVLRDEENQGRALYESLSKKQRDTATIATKVPADVFSGNNADISTMKTDDGIVYGDLDKKQQAMLKTIIMEHIYDIPRDLAYTRLDKIERGGWDKIRFSWIGSTEKFEKMYYRVQGPEFLIEYCVTSRGENHIHTLWREFDGDFGRDILAEHLKAVAH